MKRKTLPRTETVSLETEEVFAEPPKKKQKVPSRKKIAYSTTTVLRSLDENGDNSSTPLVSSLRSASFMTRKKLQQQLKKEKRVITAEMIIAKRVIGMLNKHFKEIKNYKYEPGSPSHKWSSKKAIKEFQKDMIPLAEASKKLLMKDEMVVKLDSPTYVLGDLHGNYKDLMFFKNSFWAMGMDMSPARFLFLGDYVDRGPHSVELVSYLLAMKVLHPDRIFLLRGNHEFPAQNGEEYYDPCFLQNCTELFPKIPATKIWESFNVTFEYMPLAAIIDTKIFCCHGGIPRIVQNNLGKSIKLLSLIEEINRPLLEDQVDNTEDFIALDLLWSDPATEDEEKNTDGGWFADNDRGGDIVVFGKKAVEAFVKKTGCTHIIRAHQPPSRGIEYCKSARILTVFSSSHYCGGFNSAAIVLVNENRIRVATTKPTVEEEEEDDEEMDENEDIANESEDDIIAEEDYE